VMVVAFGVVGLALLRRRRMDATPAVPIA